MSKIKENMRQKFYAIRGTKLEYIGELDFYEMIEAEKIDEIISQGELDKS
jgi:hypothetical protein